MKENSVTLLANLDIRNAMQDAKGNLLWCDKKEILKSLKDALRGKAVVADEHGMKVLAEGHIMTYTQLFNADDLKDSPETIKQMGTDVVIFGDVNLMERYFEFADTLRINHMQEILLEAVNVLFPNFTSHEWNLEVLANVGVKDKYGYNICVAKYTKKLENKG